MEPKDAHTHVPPPERLLPRLDAMVQRGRITEEEAQRVRAAGTDEERASALDVIRRRHVRERIADSVAGDEMSEAEATQMLDRVERGEDPRELRTQMRRRGRRSR